VRPNTKCNRTEHLSSYNIKQNTEHQVLIERALFWVRKDSYIFINLIVADHAEKLL